MSELGIEVGPERQLSYKCEFLCVPSKICTFVFQNGFVSAIPFLLSYIIGVGGGQVADKLRYSNTLTTGEVRKVFATAGEFKCPFISLYKITHGGLREVICEQSLFFLKFRRTQRKTKHKRAVVSGDGDMQSREPQVA